MLDMAASSLNTGSYVYYTLGVSPTSYNSSITQFNYIGSGNLSNSLGFGFYGNNNLLTITAGGIVKIANMVSVGTQNNINIASGTTNFGNSSSTVNVGINCNPAYSLDVNGTANVTALRVNGANVNPLISTFMNGKDLGGLTEFIISSVNLKFRINNGVWQIGAVSGTANIFAGGVSQVNGGTLTSLSNITLSMTTDYQNISATNSSSIGDKIVFTFSLNNTKAFEFTGVVNNSYINNIVSLRQLI